MDCPLPSVNEPAAGGHQGIGSEQSLVLRLDGFTSNAIAKESAQLGMSAEELAKFAVLYFLADLDSGRTARQIPRSLRKHISL
jgi:hypothetical protein